MNNFQISGRAGSLPQIKLTASGKVATVSIAIDRRFSNKEERETDWLKIVFFGKKAEWVEQYVKPGSGMIIQGHIRQPKSYVDKQGNKVYPGAEFIATSAEFVGSRPKSKKEDDSVDDAGSEEDEEIVAIDDEDEMEVPFS